MKCLIDQVFILFLFRLLQALKSPLKKTPGTQDAKLTDGIEIKPWVVPVQDGYEITYSCWDFAGQTVYYNTHQVIHVLDEIKLNVIEKMFLNLKTKFF